MFTRELPDTIDFHLGKFLEAARDRASLSLRDVVVRSQIPMNRLKALEAGEVSIGIRHFEAVALARVYDLDVDQILKVAVGEHCETGND